MMYRGRSRYRSHGGLPSGSSVQSGGSANMFFYQDGVNMTVSAWDDVGGGFNHALQGTASRQPTLNSPAIGGMNYDGTDDFMPLRGVVGIDAEEGFFISCVIELDDVSADNTVVGESTAVTHQFGVKSGGNSVYIFTGSTAVTLIAFNTSGLFPINEKMVITLERESGEVGNFNVWKNGVLLEQDSQKSDDGEATFNAIAGSATPLDGDIFDVIICENYPYSAFADNAIPRINSYLTSKHAISSRLQ